MDREIFNAVYKNDIDILQILLDFDLSDINYQNEYDETALMYACSTNNLNIVKILLENDADINIQNIDGNTALIGSIANQHPSIVKLLLEYNPNLNIVGESQFTTYEIVEYYADSIDGQIILDLINK